jgi:hypothetical protein
MFRLLQLLAAAGDIAVFPRAATGSGDARRVRS